MFSKVTKFQLGKSYFFASIDGFCASITNYTEGAESIAEGHDGIWVKREEAGNLISYLRITSPSISDKDIKFNDIVIIEGRWK